jgi:hypothetical protein
MSHTTSSRLLLASLLTLGPALPVLAQQQAKVVLRSGEERPALNIGFFDGNEVIVRTSFAEEPRFPVGEVAYIDFGGPSPDAVLFRGSQHAVVTRDGGILRGQVTRIAHTNQEDPKSPFVVTIRMPNGQERQVTGADIGRVYFTQPMNTMNTAGDRGRFRDTAAGAIRAEGARVIAVESRQRWTSTGIRVQQGDRLNLTSTGQIRLSNAGLTASPDGSGQNDPGAPLPQAFSGALIGRIGNGRPFGIGTQTEIEMPESGQLFLGVNDSVLTDNDGAFRVEIRRINR